MLCFGDRGGSETCAMMEHLSFTLAPASLSLSLSLSPSLLVSTPSPSFGSSDLGKRWRGGGGHFVKERDRNAQLLPGPQTKRHPEKGGKLNTSQAGSVAASRAAVGQFLSISREAFILRTR